MVNTKELIDTDKMYIKLKEFIEVNSRLPKKLSKDKSEKNLSRCLTHQKKNFKNNRLIKEYIDLSSLL